MVDSIGLCQFRNKAQMEAIKILKQLKANLGKSHSNHRTRSPSRIQQITNTQK